MTTAKQPYQGDGGSRGGRRRLRFMVPAGVRARSVASLDDASGTPLPGLAAVAKQQGHYVGLALKARDAPVAIVQHDVVTARVGDALDRQRGDAARLAVALESSDQHTESRRIEKGHPQ